MDLDMQGSFERFGWEWKKYNKIIDENFAQFKLWISSIDPSLIKDAYCIDAGGGNGRNSYWLSQLGARRIFYFDISPSSVSVARDNLRTVKNLTLSNESIYQVSLPDTEMADIVFSIGVIHHLADPLTALHNLTKLVKPGGLLVIWVYGLPGNRLLLFFLEPFRKVTKKIPMLYLDYIAGFLTIFLFLFLKFPQKNLYLKFVRKFKFSHLKSIVLDQLLPNIANYWTGQEAHDLLKNAGLKEIKCVSVNGNSYSLSGRVS